MLPLLPMDEPEEEECSFASSAELDFLSSQEFLGRQYWLVLRGCPVGRVLFESWQQDKAAPDGNSLPIRAWTLATPWVYLDGKLSTDPGVFCIKIIFESFWLGN
ncbi:hypothetical protein TURU_138163 [Turdus rufiventris]|nr:hypothetical protein TURU_138163 [Turdus rufiventris]